jgi:diguanylate cyclase (GGDEF)-like protein
MVETTQRRVLVVDDDRTTRLLLCTELAAAGYSPAEASSGAEAMAALSTGQFRIVITDWVMPGTDGLALCRGLRADPGQQSIYVIMITVNGDEPRLMEAFEAGVDDFLSKPFEPGILLARMRSACRTVDLQEALVAKNLELLSANERLLALATTDELTGLWNRREGVSRLRARWADAHRHGRPLAVAMVDIDHFKKLNDTHGHGVGDLVLADIADVLRTSCRATDTLCRYGGEEFLFILPDTDAAGAAVLAERWVRSVSAHRVVDGDLSLAATVSIGIAQRTASHRTEMDLVRSADEALYAAKEGGRNTLRVAA